MENAKRQRWLAIVLLLAGFCLLPGCGSGDYKSISGQVVEAKVQEGTEAAAFVVRTDKDEELGFFVTENTHFLSYADITEEDLLLGRQEGMRVSVICEKTKESLTTSDGKKLTAYNAVTVAIDGYKTENVLTLSDGTQVDALNLREMTVYMLPDESRLLTENTALGPENCFVSDADNLSELGQAAQDKIKAFYEEQGLLYDRRKELEKAYEEYLAAGDDAGFNGCYISQTTTPSASSERMIYFQTQVVLPVSGNQVYELYFGAAFDRQTGENVSVWDLFSCTEEEARQTIMELASPSDEKLRAELAAAFRPEYIVMGPDKLSIMFPQGCLPSQENGFYVVLDYGEGLEEILFPWALPEVKY